jgi:hypothetical protein
MPSPLKRTTRPTGDGGAAAREEGQTGLCVFREPLLYGVFLVGLVVGAPFLRYVASLGDEGILLHAAMRMLGGEVLYRDIFGILPPAGYLIVAVWMKLFGVAFASVRVLAIGVMAGIAALIYAAARLSSGSRPLAALVAMAWMVSSPGTLTVINHHWFTTAASMASAVCLFLVVGGSPGRVAAAATGLFAGAAAMTTSTRGALMCAALLALCLTVPTIHGRLVSAVAGMVAVPAGMALYLASNKALTVAIDDVMWYPILHYGGIQSTRFGSGASVQHLALVVLLPVTVLLAGVALAFHRGAEWRDPRFRVSLAVAVAGVVGCYPRPDHVHIAFAAPLACPLFARAAAGTAGPGRIAVTLIAGLSLVGLGQTVGTAVVVSGSPVVATARGVIIPDRGIAAGGFAELMVQIDSVASDGGVFFYPYSPLLPYLTGRRHPAAIDLMVPGYTSAEQFRDVCAHVVAEAQWVVVDRQWSDPNFLRRIFPAMSHPDPAEKTEFEAVLWRGFSEVVFASSRFELRKRSDAGLLARCGRI